ncbi:guanine nucleotide-binding subunit beta 1 [Paramuricea clavata]|uniref:Guanine nucleotide-binding subunit beta 1 n=1 Tax=Paramuricea clavata TaxID=317549 RepID=A0A6S7HDL6_PARCT|nr:guanine nucleotide-binding subunit beta 1 [Paramuricea clavata]CAB4002350.1 guanine nucleotide-binding subunit beta 1 [Paramuricea clavata]
MSRPPPDPVYILRGVGSPVTAVEFCTFGGNEQRLLSGDQKGIVSIWNLSTKRTEFTLDGHDNKAILTIQYLKDDTLLSHGRDGNVHIWNLNRNEIQDTLKVSDIGFCKCEIIYDFQSSGDNCLAVSSEDQSQIDIMCLKTKKIIRKLTPESSKSFGMCMCLKSIETEKKYLVAGYESGDIILWDLQSSNMVSKLCVHKEPVMCVDIDPKSNRGISGSAEEKVTVFKLTAERRLEVEKTVQIKNCGISEVKIRGDCKIFATAGWDHKLRIFSWKSLKPLAILNYHTQSVDAVAFSNCQEQLLAAGSKDGRISLWSLYKDN